MKCDTIPSLIQIEKTELEKLCTQVAETVATEIHFPKKKSTFGIADLWNARRTMRTARAKWHSRPVILSRL